MFKTILNRIFTEEPVHQNAAMIDIECMHISPSAYSEAARKIEKLGLRGILKSLPEGKVKLDLEGPHAMIEQLTRDLDAGRIFSLPCKNEVVWGRFQNKFKNLAVCAFVSPIKNVHASGDFKQ